MRNMLLNIIVVLSVFSIQGCWASEIKGATPDDGKSDSTDLVKNVSEESPGQNVQKESEKAGLIQKILAAHELEVWKGNLNAEQYQFCTRFYEDLKSASPEIEYIEPDVRTDDPNHPALEKYRNSCARYDGPARRESYWNLFDLGEAGFRLYRRDFDGNPKNGEEELVYADRSFKNKKLGQFGGFKFIDLSECKLQGVKTTRGYENIGANGRPVSVENVNALISIENQYYAMELYDRKSKSDKPSQYKVELWELNKNLKFKQACVVRWRPHLLKNINGEDE